MFDIFLCAACKNTDSYPRSLLIRLPTNPAIVSSQQQAFLSCAEERAPERITSCPTLIQDHISAVETGLPSNKPKFLFQLPRSIKNMDPVSGLSVVCSLMSGAVPGKHRDMLSQQQVQAFVRLIPPLPATTWTSEADCSQGSTVKPKSPNIWLICH